jgi:hypothetical protein
VGPGHQPVKQALQARRDAIGGLVAPLGRPTGRSLIADLNELELE